MRTSEKSSPVSIVTDATWAMPEDGLDGRELVIDAPSDLPAVLRAHASPSAAR